MSYRKCVDGSPTQYLHINKQMSTNFLYDIVYQQQLKSRDSNAFLSVRSQLGIKDANNSDNFCTPILLSLLLSF